MPRDSCWAARLVQRSIIHLFCFKLALMLKQLPQYVRVLVLHQCLSNRGLGASGRARIALLCFAWPETAKNPLSTPKLYLMNQCAGRAFLPLLRKLEVVHHTKPMAGPAHSGCQLAFLQGISSQLFPNAFIWEHSVFMCFQWSLTKDPLKSNYETTLNIAPPLLIGCWGGRK